MTYLAWYDDDRKKPAREKIDEAVNRFVEKYGYSPNLCLVNESESVKHDDLVVKPVHRVARHTYWIGYDQTLAGGAACD
ncbi:MAG: hypothetical protein M1319_05390 [Chloroflexi bacterium]|nr:hypothetical protein [Chloroflexota bacterium]